MPRRPDLDLRDTHRQPDRLSSRPSRPERRRRRERGHWGTVLAVPVFIAALAALVNAYWAPHGSGAQRQGLHSPVAPPP